MEIPGLATEWIDGENRVVLTLPFPAHAKGALCVHSAGGEGTDPQILIDRGLLTLLASAVEAASPDDRALWEARFEEQRRVCEAAHARRLLAAGAPLGDVLTKLTQRGFSNADALDAVRGT